ncbi:DUF3054 domain-containing protein [Timonella senegalensis]|uniref:DUF3054 domain-containing protein n=1 Tax=Timonella senegalensis TaxID=1465825 RepID=UPI0028A739C8|nr:DUF3054 domain-containing protein [Timonella senegalensis]
MKRTAIWALLDIAVVMIFAASGRSTHDEQNTLVGVFGTALPFLLALAIAWVTTRQWSFTTKGSARALLVWPAAILLALITWAGGLGLRVLLGDTISGGFPLVALGFLTLCLVGWRAIWALIESKRAGRSSL